MTKSFAIEIILEEDQSWLDLYGIKDEHLKYMEKAFEVRIFTAKGKIIIEGEKDGVGGAEKLFKELNALMSASYSLNSHDLRFMVRMLAEDINVDLKEVFSERVPVYTKKGYVTPKSLAQKEYIRAIRQHDIVVGIGPAGTGKTYLAVAMAVAGLQKKEFNRIVLARPAVEAGEKLGFLPGDLYEKVNPYLRPLYDALYDMIEYDKIQRLIERSTIEIAPLAYMRGRTLNDSFVILDEAQNTTSEQMKMFLTRLGFNSKAVITGDITQVDLPEGRMSGLVEIRQILKRIAGIRFVYFSEKDVVRHELVQEIIKAYEEYELKKKKGSKQ